MPVTVLSAQSPASRGSSWRWVGLFPFTKKEAGSERRSVSAWGCTVGAGAGIGGWGCVTAPHTLHSFCRAALCICLDGESREAPRCWAKF